MLGLLVEREVENGCTTTRCTIIMSKWCMRLCCRLFLIVYTRCPTC